MTAKGHLLNVLSYKKMFKPWLSPSKLSIIPNNLRNNQSGMFCYTSNISLFQAHSFHFPKLILETLFSFLY